MLSVGTLVAGHGVRGLARVKPHNPDSPALAGCTAVWLKPRTADRATRFDVKRVQAYKKLFLVGLDGIDSLNDLEPWFRSEVSVEMSTVPEAEGGEFYHFEVIGLTVKTVDGEAVGKIIEVLAHPGNDLWVLESVGAGPLREILIPVVGEIVKEVDLAEGFAVIDPPLGLLDED